MLSSTFKNHKEFCENLVKAELTKVLQESLQQFYPFSGSGKTFSNTVRTTDSLKMDR